MSTHTPAPWYVNTDHATDKPEYIRAHVDGEMYDVASMLCDETGNAAANARLIASAPELLALLQMVLDDPDSEVLGEDWNSRAEAIIQKVEGAQ